MDTRVCAPAACDGHRLSQLEAQALLHRGLHAVGVRLDLVAMIATAVVGHVDEITRHLLITMRKNREILCTAAII